MALETYKINTTTDDVYFSQPISSISDSLHPYLEHLGVIAVFNKKGSGKIVRMKNITIDIINKVGVNTTLPYYVDVQKITDYTGGDVVTAIKMDNNNASLPSQVTCVQKPSTVTTSGQKLAKIAVNPVRNMQAVLDMGFKGGGHRDIGASIISRWKDATTGQTQKITLREGEGLGIVNNTSCFWAPAMRTEFVIRDTSSGACYTFSSETKWNDLSPLVLLNGSGSGVVLEVIAIHVTETGTENISGSGTLVPPRFIVAAVDLADISRGAGVALTPQPLDSNNSIGSDIVCYKNCLIKWQGSKQGAIYVRPEKYVYFNQFSQNDANLAILPVSVFQRYKSGITSKDRTLDIILREGEGLAVQQTTASKFVNHEISFVFTTQNIFPTEAEVEDGINYGQEGDDKTGTLVGGGGDDVYFGVFSA